MAEATHLEIGQKLVALSNAGNDAEAVDTLYDEKVVSIEGQDGEDMPARMEGVEAVRQKHAWWNDNHEIHSSVATGPYAGFRDDQFVVRFNLDATFKPTGERSPMEEVALFTVKNGKIVQEEFLYLAE